MPLTRILLCISALLFSSFAMGQNSNNTAAVRPIAISKNALSGLGLKPVKNASQPERKLFQQNIFLGEEIGVFIVASETAKANWKSYALDEFIFVLNGRARLQPEGEKNLFYNKGDFFVAPKGFEGEWETQGGASIYHELSVIALGRKKTETVSGKVPVRIDPLKLNGIDLSLKSDGTYADSLFSGEELTVSTLSEEPSKRQIVKTQRDQLIYVLAGKVSLTTSDDNTATFYTNEFFILPKGFSGTWQSEGHDLFRSLSITKTK